MFALNQGEVCTCPSRALVDASIFDKFLADATERTKKVVQGNPLDTETMIGAQASRDQLEKILQPTSTSARTKVRGWCAAASASTSAAT